MPPSDDLLGGVLQRVSRSFYLSLAILPRDLREPIGLAYLLARAADTVADTRLVARTERIRHLETLRRAFSGEAADVSEIWDACAPLQKHEAERTLIERVGEGVARLDALPGADRTPVRAVLSTLTSGMLFDLTRFPGEDAASLAALDTVEELDRYTYLVAGCVGEFWTALHVAHRPRLGCWNVAQASADGVRFGKALQMTNVLRDIPQDLRGGRCYLPARELATVGLQPADLLDPASASRVEPVIRRLVSVALDHYDVAWRYTLAIPRLEVRMRLACVWPLLIGLGTLARVVTHPDPLQPGSPIKISRSDVRAILARSTVMVWSNRALRAEARHFRRRIPA